MKPGTSSEPADPLYGWAVVAAGMLMTCVDILKKYPLETDDEIRHALSGNLCRCTGYTHIVAAVRSVRDRMGRQRS